MSQARLGGNAATEPGAACLKIYSGGQWLHQGERHRASGIGREGPRHARRDMTEERLVSFNL